DRREGRPRGCAAGPSAKHGGEAQTVVRPVGRGEGDRAGGGGAGDVLDVRLGQSLGEWASRKGQPPGGVEGEGTIDDGRWLGGGVADLQLVEEKGRRDLRFHRERRHSTDVARLDLPAVGGDEAVRTGNARRDD